MDNNGYGLLIVGALALLPAGCVSLPVVEDYAAHSRATIASTKPVAEDFYHSCLRANSYKPLAMHSKCETELGASRAILQIASVLDAYTATLGALAADQLADYGAELNQLTDEVKKLEGMKERQVDAIGQLSLLIANTATSAYRQKQMVRFLRGGDQAVGVVAEGLADLLESHYRRAINLELTAWTEGYRRVERVARDSNPLAREGHAQTQWRQYNELQARLATTASLAGSLRAIGHTHHKLTREAEQISGQEVYASVRAFIENTKPVLKEVQAAFSNQWVTTHGYKACGTRAV
ncbi:MAG TPA: hypothetical protein ENN98_05525 [Desulfurivibrio alkaliphilus]|uniref:Uncharacterized protein n=1 Tax=Desulfurivibrio alkaliphilus TaxID=427923 RepID=A0A7C2XAC6_9BACT|nr:hypothetical protein [Desulfurivibrio alkaliphilus]